MTERPTSHSPARLAELAERHGTPLYVYDAARIRAQFADLADFDTVRYAQKANGNPAILRSPARTGSPGRCVVGR